MNINIEKKKDIICILLFALCSIVSLLYAIKISNADDQWEAKSIAYNTSKTNLNSNNVSDALDELNSMLDGTTYSPNNTVVCSDYTDGCKKVEEEVKENPKTGDGLVAICLLVAVSAGFLITTIMYILKLRKKQL